MTPKLWGLFSRRMGDGGKIATVERMSTSFEDGQP